MLNTKGNEIWVDGHLDALHFEVRPNLPWPFGDLEKIIGEAILNALSGPITDIVRLALGRIHFKAFELPGSFPGSPVPGNFSLETVEFKAQSLQALVGIS